MNVVDEVFDPEQMLDEAADETDSDEGQSVFRSKALSVAEKEKNKEPATMARTRSQTISTKADIVGKTVFTHKGKAIPCWFPGKVLEKTAKGYSVKFLAEFGNHVCAEKNLLMFDEYLLKKNDTSALFKVPSKLKSSFEEALKLANGQ